jgi:PBP1b-binding outer membrane lipoprotein LpoB
VPAGFAKKQITKSKQQKANNQKQATKSKQQKANNKKQTTKSKKPRLGWAFCADCYYC